eukprot:5105327-Pleurochrysis_carterae.AAC.1
MRGGCVAAQADADAANTVRTHWLCAFRPCAARLSRDDAAPYSCLCLDCARASCGCACAARSRFGLHAWP